MKAISFTFYDPRESLPSEERVAERMFPHVVICHVRDNRGFYDDHDMPWRGTGDRGSETPLLRSVPRPRCVREQGGNMKHGYLRS